jgi:hypothetical protein
MITLSVETAGRAVLGLGLGLMVCQASKRGSQPLSGVGGPPLPTKVAGVPATTLGRFSTAHSARRELARFWPEKAGSGRTLLYFCPHRWGEARREIVVSLYPVAHGDALGLYPPTLALTARPFGDRIA